MFSHANGVAISVALTLVLLSAGVGLASAPTDQVQRSVDEVLKVSGASPTPRRGGPSCDGSCESTT